MRKSTMLSLFAALLLIAGTVMAQQPDHRSVTGTVLSYTPGEQLVVETDDGQKTFKVVAGSTLPNDDEIEVGDVIVVDWNVGDDAQAMPEIRTVRVDDRATDRMATRERETMETTETTETTTRDTTTRSATEQQRADRTSTRDQDTVGTTSRQQETTSQRSAQTRSSLPQTGSNLPLIGLIGLLTLTGAATLTLRR